MAGEPESPNNQILKVADTVMTPPRKLRYVQRCGYRGRQQ